MPNCSICGDPTHTKPRCPHRDTPPSEKKAADAASLGTGQKSLEEPEGVLETSAAAKRMAPKKVKNRSFTREDVAALAGAENIMSAAVAAKIALQDWYIRCERKAHVIIPRMQIESNLEKVAAIPGWIEEKGLRKKDTSC